MNVCEKFESYFYCCGPKEKNPEELKDFSSNRSVEVVRGTVLVSLRKLPWLALLSPTICLLRGREKS